MGLRSRWRSSKNYRRRMRQMMQEGGVIQSTVMSDVLPTIEEMKRATKTYNPRKRTNTKINKKKNGGLSNRLRNYVIEGDYPAYKVKPTAIRTDAEKQIEAYAKQFKSGGNLTQIRKKPGNSNVGKKTFADGSKRRGPYVGNKGGAHKKAYPIPTIEKGRSALKLAHNAPNPSGIKNAVYKKYPSLKKNKTTTKKKDGGYAINALDYMFGLHRGKNKFRMANGGPHKFTTSPFGHTLPYPIYYQGVNPGQGVVDQGIAMPGEDFMVRGNEIREYPMMQMGGPIINMPQESTRTVNPFLNISKAEAIKKKRPVSYTSGVGKVINDTMDDLLGKPRITAQLDNSANRINDRVNEYNNLITRNKLEGKIRLNNNDYIDANRQYKKGGIIPKYSFQSGGNTDDIVLTPYSKPRPANLDEIGFSEDLNMDFNRKPRPLSIDEINQYDNMIHFDYNKSPRPVSSELKKQILGKPMTDELTMFSTGKKKTYTPKQLGFRYGGTIPKYLKGEDLRPMEIFKPGSNHYNREAWNDSTVNMVLNDTNESRDGIVGSYMIPGVVDAISPVISEGDYNLEDTGVFSGEIDRGGGQLDKRSIEVMGLLKTGLIDRDEYRKLAYNDKVPLPEDKLKILREKGDRSGDRQYAASNFSYRRPDLGPYKFDLSAETTSTKAPTSSVSKPKVTTPKSKSKKMSFVPIPSGPGSKIKKTSLSGVPGAGRKIGTLASIPHGFPGSTYSRPTPNFNRSTMPAVGSIPSSSVKSEQGYDPYKTRWQDLPLGSAAYNLGRFAEGPRGEVPRFNLEADKAISTVQGLKVRPNTRQARLQTNRVMDNIRNASSSVPGMLANLQNSQRGLAKIALDADYQAQAQNNQYLATAASMLNQTGKDRMLERGRIDDLRAKNKAAQMQHLAALAAGYDQVAENRMMQDRQKYADELQMAAINAKSPDVFVRRNPKTGKLEYYYRDPSSGEFLPVGDKVTG